MSIQPFKRFQEMFTLVKTTKKYDAELEKEALNWYEKNFNATFGSHSRCDQKHLPFLWYYTTGILIFSVHGVGGYHYKFIIKAAMFEILNESAYKEGHKHVNLHRKAKIQLNRDANPYPEYDFYHRQAWDCGYIMRLHNKKLLS